MLCISILPIYNNIRISEGPTSFGITCHVTVYIVYTEISGIVFGMLWQICNDATNTNQLIYRR